MEGILYKVHSPECVRHTIDIMCKIYPMYIGMSPRDQDLLVEMADMDQSSEWSDHQNQKQNSFGSDMFQSPQKGDSKAQHRRQMSDYKAAQKHANSILSEEHGVGRASVPMKGYT